MRVTFNNSCCSQAFVWVQPGEFKMGSQGTPMDDAGRFGGKPQYYACEKPQHKVIISQGFWMCKTQVTFQQFCDFVDSTGYPTDAETNGWGYGHDEKGTWGPNTSLSWRKPEWAPKPDHPVVLVSWNDVQRYLEWLTDTSGKPFRLPTEAEWEYACRAGSQTQYPWGDSISAAVEYGNFSDKSTQLLNKSWEAVPWANGHTFVSPVSSFRPNAWGLFDMVGNVWEWCADWFGPYPPGEVTDPTGPLTGTHRVRRGGSWCYYLRSARCSFRHRYLPTDRDSSVGFRICYS